ncbi:hypothetical protein AAMO2058_000785000 [Amorphochlora amoebiformis]
MRPWVLTLCILGWEAATMPLMPRITPWQPLYKLLSRSTPSRVRPSPKYSPEGPLRKGLRTIKKSWREKGFRRAALMTKLAGAVALGGGGGARASIDQLWVDNGDLPEYTYMVLNESRHHPDYIESDSPEFDSVLWRYAFYPTLDPASNDASKLQLVASAQLGNEGDNKTIPHFLGFYMNPNQFIDMFRGLARDNPPNEYLTWDFFWDDVCSKPYSKAFVLYAMPGSSAIPFIQHMKGLLHGIFRPFDVFNVKARRAGEALFKDIEYELQSVNASDYSRPYGTHLAFTFAGQNVTGIINGNKVSSVNSNNLAREVMLTLFGNRPMSWELKFKAGVTLGELLEDDKEEEAEYEGEDGNKDFGISTFLDPIKDTKLPSQSAWDRVPEDKRKQIQNQSKDRLQDISDKFFETDEDNDYHREMNARKK